MDTVFILFNRFNTAAFITEIFADSGAAFIRGRSLFLNSKIHFIHCKQFELNVTNSLSSDFIQSSVQV